MTALRQGSRTGSAGLLLAVVVLGGCVSAEPRRMPASDELTRLRAEIAALEQRHLSGREQQASVIERLDRLELQGLAASREGEQLAARLATLGAELARVARETEELATRVDQATADSADRLAAVSDELPALSQRLNMATGQLQELTTRLAGASGEQARTSPPGRAKPPDDRPPTPPEPRSAAGPPTIPPPAPAPSEAAGLDAPPRADRHELYDAGYTEFGRGNYALAMGAFREFIRRNPNHDLADNAQYWIAEAYLSLAHRYVNAAESERAAAAFAEAIEAFRHVSQRYPHGDKVPAALFREASTHFELGETDRARARLEYLIRHFPAAPESRLARQRLADGAGR